MKVQPKAFELKIGYVWTIGPTAQEPSERSERAASATFEGPEKKTANDKRL